MSSSSLPIRCQRAQHRAAQPTHTFSHFLTLFESVHALFYLAQVRQCKLKVYYVNVVKRVNLMGVVFLGGGMHSTA